MRARVADSRAGRRHGAQAYADAFCSGSVTMAHSTLLLRKERPASWPLLSLGLRLGFALSLLVWIAWDNLVDPQVRPARDRRGAEAKRPTRRRATSAAWSARRAAGGSATAPRATSHERGDWDRDAGAHASAA